MNFVGFKGEALNGLQGNYHKLEANMVEGGNIQKTISL
jgi:hypothetical protein